MAREALKGNRGPHPTPEMQIWPSAADDRKPAAGLPQRASPLNLHTPRDRANSSLRGPAGSDSLLTLTSHSRPAEVYRTLRCMLFGRSLPFFCADRSTAREDPRGPAAVP